MMRHRLSSRAQRGRAGRVRVGLVGLGLAGATGLLRLLGPLGLAWTGAASAAAGAAAPPAAQAAAPAYVIDTVASGLEHPWSLAFLPDGRLLVTERPGRLRVLEPLPPLPTAPQVPRWQLHPQAVAGVPAVLAQGQAGLFEVLPHPDFARNQQLYLSYAHGSLQSNHLRVWRARLAGHTLQDGRAVFTSQPAKPHTQHFGARMAWLPDGTLAFGLGDGNLERTDAQRLHTHLGKLLRITADGGVPPDNPFVGRQGARPEIYSLGHRNPQGVVVVAGQLYAHEHGARGGDELNRIVPGGNYGWPLVTGGVDYTYARITPFRTLPGLQAPWVEWTPSVAPAGLAWYEAALFPAWRGSFFVATLKERSVRRVPMAAGRPGAQERLFEELGERLRDVRVGPDGALYLLTDSPQGRVLRVRPK